MNDEVIYEKKYPCTDLMKELVQAEVDGADEPDQPNPSFDEIMQKICANTTYVLMPERTKASEEFVRAAIEVSERYNWIQKLHVIWITSAWITPLTVEVVCVTLTGSLVWQTIFPSSKTSSVGTLQFRWISLPMPWFGMGGPLHCKTSAALFNDLSVGKCILYQNRS